MPWPTLRDATSVEDTAFSLMLSPAAAHADVAVGRSDHDVIHELANDAETTPGELTSIGDRPGIGSQLLTEAERRPIGYLHLPPLRSDVGDDHHHVRTITVFDDVRYEFTDNQLVIADNGGVGSPPTQCVDNERPCHAGARRNGSEGTLLTICRPPGHAKFTITEDP